MGSFVVERPGIKAGRVDRPSQTSHAQVTQTIDTDEICDLLRATTCRD